MQPKYRYYVSAGIVVRREVFPLNVRELKENFALNDDDHRFSFESTLTGELVFTGDDFAFFYQLEQSGEKCKSLVLEIETFCSGAFIPFRSCLLKLINGQWDLDRCTLQIKTTVKNEYTCYEEAKDKEIDLLEAPLTRKTARYLKGTLEFVDYTGSDFFIDDPERFGGILPQEGGWKCYRAELYRKSSVLGQNPFYKFYYAREIFTLPPDASPGVGWTELPYLGGVRKWVRFPLLANYSTVPFEVTDPDYIYYKGTTLFSSEIIGNTLSGDFDNGLPLQEILRYYIGNFCGLQVKSDFFQINPDASFAETYPMLPDDETTNILAFQKSDVKRSAAQNNATKAIITPDVLFRELFTLYNLFYRIEGGFFRVEHISWFGRLHTLDLTSRVYKDRIKLTRQYSYKTDKLPKTEVFKSKEAGSADFVGLPIEYIGDCVSDDPSNREKVYPINNITTDVEYCILNSSSDSNKVSDVGIVLISCKPDDDGELFIISKEPVLETVAHLNNVLGWAHLHKTYHLHERLQAVGYLNGSFQRFLSTKPSRKRRPISIPFCCTDTINLMGTVLTEMGVARIEGCRKSLYHDELQLDLVYHDPVGNLACLRPSKFSFQELKDDVFFFLTAFVEPGAFNTELNAVLPDGTEQTVFIDSDEGGVKPHSFGPLQVGVYRFRKRLRCGIGFESPWTDYFAVNTDLANGGTCTGFDQSITYVLRQIYTFKFLIQEVVSDAVQCEITRPDPDMAPYIVNVEKQMLTNATNVLATVGYTSLDIILGKDLSGMYQFRFRRVCDAATGSYSNWSAPVEVIV